MSWAGVTSFGGGKRDEENENDSNLHDLELENGQRDIDGAVSIGEVGGPARFRHIKNRKYMRRLYLVLAALAAIFVFSSLLRVSMRSKRSPSSRGFDLDLAGTSLREEHALIFMYDATRTSMSAGDLADLKDAKTPQRKALQWLANEDKLQIEIPKNFNDEIHEAFSQRYSVAVLAFAWGENVLRPLGFLSGKSECDWNTDFQRPDISTLKMGIICDDQGKRVEKIVLQTLGLTGELPTELGNLVDLTRIHLDGNNFQGQIGPQFHRLSNLRDLTITRNQLTGRLPAFFGRLNNLHHVELSFNQLSGSISSGFHEGSGNNDATVDGGQSQIQILGLDHNKFSGSLDSVEKLSSLQELYLNDNKLTGRVVDHFKGFKNLGILDLSSNKLEGKIPDYLLELDRLAIVR